MEWKDFSKSQKEYPERIVEKTIEGFSKATGSLVTLNIVPMSDMGRITSKLSNDFQYDLYINSPYVGSYSFKLITFGYDVELMPIYLTIEESIREELFEKKHPQGARLKIEDEKSFVSVLESIFHSERFADIVSGLMKIAEKNRAGRNL